MTLMFGYRDGIPRVISCRCALVAGRLTLDAEARLRLALAIFQRIGAAEAADVFAELQALSTWQTASAHARRTELLG